jgi:hypothetical protein
VPKNAIRSRPGIFDAPLPTFIGPQLAPFPTLEKKRVEHSHALGALFFLFV